MAIVIPFLELVLISAALFLTFLWFRKKKDPRYPPGPTPLPIIGNLHQLGKFPQRTLDKWGDQYGPAFSIKMGFDDTIILSDHKLIKEVFSDVSSTGRTTNPVFLAFANGNYGVIFAEGHHWEQQRRFTLKTLRDFGFAKTAMEGMILEEVNSLLKWFDKHLNRPVNGIRIFNGAVVNSLWNIISGERTEWDAPEQPPILRATGNMVEAINRMTMNGLIFLPLLRYISPDALGWSAWLESISDVTTICKKSTDEHRSKLQPDSPKDFIDHYLLEMKNETNPSSSFFKETGENNLKALIPDLFVAGSETTSHTSSWALLYLAHHPQVQKKMQEELDAIIGPGRQPSVSDKSSLPYSEATIMEVLRKTSVVVNGVPHRMIKDAVFQGYFFPKGATVLSNLYKVHQDPKVWGDPENFRPERFLSPDGKTVVRPDAFMPFATGRRMCLGKSLAEDTLFLFITCIMQKYNLRPGPNSTIDELKKAEPKGKLLNEPEPFNIVVSLRKEE